MNVFVKEHLSVFDLFIVVFFSFIFIIIPRFRRASKPSSDEEYLIMGKSLSLPLFVATLTASWYGGIFGVTQIAFEQGFYSFVTQGVFWYIAYFLFAIFLAKKIRREKVLSLPELVGLYFGIKARKISAIILFFHALPITYAISVALFIKLIFNLSFFWSLILGVGMVAIYTAKGGLRGVVVTDVVQFVLMFTAVLMIVVVSYFRYGGMDYLFSTLPPHYFALRGTHEISSVLIWLFIACTSTFIHPVFYQRCLAARSDKTAQMGIILAMGFFFIFDICTSLGGMYARAVLPGADSALAYVSLGILILPFGLKGLFLAGVLATILSTLDSFMLVSGTALSYDLWPKAKVFQAYAHQVGIFLCAGLIIGFGAYFGSNFENLWLFFEGAFSAAMVAPVLFAIFLKTKHSPRNFILPSCAAIFMFIFSRILCEYNLITFEPFYIAHATAFLLCIILQLHAHSDTKVANFTHG